MPDFERTATVPASPDQAFQFLSNPKNLPSYVSEMVLARPEQGDRLHVAAEVQGRHEEGEAHFRSDPSQRRLEWGGEDARYRTLLPVVFELLRATGLEPEMAITLMPWNVVGPVRRSGPAGVM